MATISIGLKLGQPLDASGLVVAERDRYTFIIHTLHRYEAGTPYTLVAEQVAGIVGKLPEHYKRVYLDITGLGTPIQELVTRRLKGLHCPLVPLTFTYGDKFDWRVRPWVVGKLHLLNQIKALLQEGWLLLPDVEEARRLVQDIKAYQPSLDPQANERYGAFQVGKRDELVTALGLAVLDSRTSMLEVIEHLQGRVERTRQSRDGWNFGGPI